MKNTEDDLPTHRERILRAEKCHQINQHTILRVNCGWKRHKNMIRTKAATLQTLEHNLNSVFICSQLVQHNSLCIIQLPARTFFKHPKIYMLNCFMKKSGGECSDTVPFL